MKPLDTSQDAPWKQRYRAPSVLWSQIATLNPQRGALASNASGVYQVYAWDVPSGNLTQITHQPTGLYHGDISADGRSIYYLKDDHGNELGHYVRVPFEGGESEDLTPDLPPYASFTLAESRDGSVLAFITSAPKAARFTPSRMGSARSSGRPRPPRVASSFRRTENTFSFPPMSAPDATSSVWS